jgi:hypothetical protein
MLRTHAGVECISTNIGVLLTDLDWARQRLTIRRPRLGLDRSPGVWHLLFRSIAPALAGAGLEGQVWIPEDRPYFGVVDADDAFCSPFGPAGCRRERPTALPGSRLLRGPHRRQPRCRPPASVGIIFKSAGGRALQ